MSTTILRNVEILRMIFELLDFEDQLKLATVCRHLYNFFTTFIWNAVYRQLSITKHGQSVCVRNVETSENFVLSLHGLDYFLKVYAESIEELVEKHDVTINCQGMRNLTRISYNHMIITNEHLELLACCCPLLDTLHIYGCCNSQREIIRFGQDLKVQTLMQMRRLQSFALKTASEFRGKTGALQEIFTQIKLKYYYLKMAIIGGDDEEEEYCNDTVLEAGKQLQELDLYGPFHTARRKCNLNTYLNYFQNLTHLTLCLSDVATGDEVILPLAGSCKKLQKLAFNLTTFENVQTFAVFMSLTDLSFHRCRGLTYDHLKEILSEMRLEKFSSVYTKYQGLFQYYFVSPTLKSIHIDAFHSFEFRSS